MKKMNLLPRWCRFLGIAMVIPCLVLFVNDPEVVFGEATLFGSPTGNFVKEVFALFDKGSGDEDGKFVWYSWIKNDLSNEILLTFMLMGTFFIAFSRIREEDEFSKQLRLEAMSQAILYNSILLLIFNWVFYDGLFLYILVSQLFSFLLLFSLIFSLKIRAHNKLLAHEE